MNKKRVSEIITVDLIKNWEQNEIITISAGTGVGKSYFIKNILYAFAKASGKKILMLIHRCNCTNQFQQEIIKDKKTDVIHIKTYQSLEQNDIDLSLYQYIVCDEFHYFMSDASFNKTTDISLNKILALDCIRIFMSATGNIMKRYINNYRKYKITEFEIPISYGFINALTFFNKDVTMENFIEECIKKNEKAVFFIESAKKAYEIYTKYKKDCLFNCSKSNKTYYKYVDKDKINKMLENEFFTENILITTTCMDAGVNIIDTSLHHIICDIEDIGVIIQCIGRKRIQNDDDYLNVYIKSMSNSYLGGKKTQLKRRIEKSDYLRNHTVKEYLLKYPRTNDYSNIIYDEIIADDENCTKKINELMYFKCLNDINIIDAMLQYGKYGFNKYISYNVFEFNDYRIIEEDEKISELSKYLSCIINKKLEKSKQKELINKINLKDSRGRIQKSIGILNQYLIENFDMTLTSKIIKEDNIKKTYWVMSEIA